MVRHRHSKHTVNSRARAAAATPAPADAVSEEWTLDKLRLDGLFMEWPSLWAILASIVGMVGIAKGISVFVIKGAEEVPYAFLYACWPVLLIERGIDALQHEARFYPAERRPSLAIRAAQIGCYAAPLSVFFLGAWFIAPFPCDGMGMFLTSSWVGTSIWAAGNIEAAITHYYARRNLRLRVLRLGRIGAILLKSSLVMFVLLIAGSAVLARLRQPPGPARYWLMTLSSNGKTVATENVDLAADPVLDPIAWKIVTKSDADTKLVVLERSDDCLHKGSLSTLRVRQIGIHPEDSRTEWKRCLIFSPAQLRDWVMDGAGNLYFLHQPLVTKHKSMATITELSQNGQLAGEWDLQGDSGDLFEDPAALGWVDKGQIVMLSTAQTLEKPSAIAIRRLTVEKERLAVMDKTYIGLTPKAKLQAVKDFSDLSSGLQIRGMPGLLRSSAAGIAFVVASATSQWVVKMQDSSGRGLSARELHAVGVRDLDIDRAGNVYYAGDVTVARQKGNSSDEGGDSAPRHALAAAAATTDNDDGPEEPETVDIVNWVMGKLDRKGSWRKGLTPRDSGLRTCRVGSPIFIKANRMSQTFVVGRAENVWSSHSGSDWCMRKFLKDGRESEVTQAVIGGPGPDLPLAAALRADGKIIVFGTGYGYGFSRELSELRL